MNIDFSRVIKESLFEDGIVSDEFRQVEFNTSVDAGWNNETYNVDLTVNNGNKSVRMMLNESDFQYNGDENLVLNINKIKELINALKNIM